MFSNSVYEFRLEMQLNEVEKSVICQKPKTFNAYNRKLQTLFYRASVKKIAIIRHTSDRCSFQEIACKAQFIIFLVCSFRLFAFLGALFLLFVQSRFISSLSFGSPEKFECFGACFYGLSLKFGYARNK